MNRASVFAFLLVLAIAARGASPAPGPSAISASNPSGGFDRDLGQGLAYHRVHQLPADLPTAETARRQPCVLDLRYVEGGAEAAAALAAWLKFHATAHAPVFILANAATSGALVAPLSSPHPGASIVVIGGAGDAFAPDIAVKISPGLERQAYDALEHGVAVGTLLTENADKPRNDEAKLAKDRATDPSPADELAVSPPADSDNAPKPKPPPPLIDAALQRAVQLHRTLVALKKL